jgi:hypothetical protein
MGNNFILGKIEVLESVVKDLKKTVNALQDTVNKLSDKLLEVGKPPWNTLAVWAMVILVFVGMVGGSIINNIISNQNRIESLLVRTTMRLNETQTHGASIDSENSVKINALEKTLLSLGSLHSGDMRIYREDHKQLQETLRLEISRVTNELDVRIQREMNDRILPVDRKLEALERRFFDLYGGKK